MAGVTKGAIVPPTDFGRNRNKIICYSKNTLYYACPTLPPDFQAFRRLELASSRVALLLAIPPPLYTRVVRPCRNFFETKCLEGSLEDERTEKVMHTQTTHYVTYVVSVSSVSVYESLGRLFFFQLYD